MRVGKKSNIIRVVAFVLLGIFVHLSFVNFKFATDHRIDEHSVSIMTEVTDAYSQVLTDNGFSEEMRERILEQSAEVSEEQIKINIMYMRRQIYGAAYVMIFIVIICFIVGFVMILQLQRKSEKAESDRVALEIANEQMNSCVFDYNLQTRKITFTGNYKSIIGSLKNPIDVKEFRNVYVNIHEEDRSAMTKLKDCFETGEIKDQCFSAEIRYKCPDGQYRWYKVVGCTAYDKTSNGKDDKPTHFVGNFTDVNAQVNHEKELRHIAETDMLSGLLNKSFYQKKVTEFLKNSPEGTKGAFFIIDLDNFKTTNDTLGHVMGDIAIRDTAQKISLIFSHKDILGRIGGDEFCAFLRMDNVSDVVAAKIIMEKAASLNETLQEYYNNEKDSVQISASVGIALYPQHGTDFQALFRCADAALYYVKKNGKNGNVIYTNKMKNGDERFYE